MEKEVFNMRLESNYVQSQKQKQTMKLAMTQQLSQSIAMLQFTTADLTTFLEDKALENPLIEVIYGHDIATDYSYTKKKKNFDTENDWLEQVADTRETLAEHLKNQVALMKLSSHEKIILLYLIESLNEAGYLATDIETIATGLLMSEEAILSGLEVLQSLEPAGVGARDAKECILLQIDRSPDAPYIAYDVISKYFNEFAGKKWKPIADDFEVSLSEIQQVSDFVQTLNPKPGLEFESERVQYVVPDLILQQDSEQLFVSVAKQFIPQIKFQNDYYKMMQDTKEKDVLNFLKDKTGEYDWLVRGIEQREDTLKRVGKAIVAHQKEHFLKNAPLEPLTLKEIAEEIGVHESTVSRAVNGKYMETNQGVFELKSFFSSGLQQKKTSDTGANDVSSASIKQLITDFVKEEPKAKPLSDQKIVDLLQEKGIEVSRRAIAKYRTELNIPSSSKRKRFDE
jgi:RNA polymerase sigma-54 factor